MYQHILVKIQRLPESLDTLKSLAPILDSVFRKRVPSLAIEAFVDYWKLTYARIPTPERGWPKTIRHCLSIAGMLPVESMNIEDDDILSNSNALPSSPLGTAFSLPPSSPRTPISASFSTPPTAILKREAMSKVPSPQRPTKAFRGFPIVPSTPVSPVRRRSRSSVGTRTPLSAIQLCGSPTKRRRLLLEEGEEEKENVGVGGVMSVAERIAANGQKPTSKKRRHEDDGDNYLGGMTLPTPAKKLKSRMKPKVKPTPKNAKMKNPSSPAPSVASSNESEDERWVEQAVGVAFPAMKDGGDVQPPLAFSYKRQRSNGGGLEEPGRGLQQRPQQPRIVSLNSRSYSSPPPVKIDLRTVPLRRSTSIPDFVSTAIQRKRKRRESDASDLYDRVVSSDPPLAALSLRHAAKMKIQKVFGIPLSDSETSSSLQVLSSDDDPHLGQVTPHHIISPAPLQSRVGERGCDAPKSVFGGLFGDESDMPGSDDSVPSTTSSFESEVDSPTKQVLLRHLRRTAV